MKTLELNNLPAPVLLVWGLPEDVKVTDKVISHRLHKCGVMHYEHMPEGRWHLIGRLSELTEERARLLVNIPEQGNYRCYKLFRGQFHNVEETALESFHSSIEAEGYYVENPLDYLLQSTEENFYNEKCDSTEVDIVQGRWQDVQSKTLPTNTLVFKRI